MPLRTLWNSLFGRGGNNTSVANTGTSVGVGTANAPKTIAAPRATDVSQQVSQPSSRKSATKRSAKAKSLSTRTPASAAPSLASPPALNNAPRSVLPLLNRTRPDVLASIVIERLGSPDQKRRVLEIGVGDGSRTATLLGHLHSIGWTADRLDYVVIDQFELCGSPVTLIDYHARLRGVPLRPSIIPDTLDRGLTRVLHRHGLIDLVIVDPTVGVESLRQHQASLTRLQRPAASLLQSIEGRWQSAPANHRRAA